MFQFIKNLFSNEDKFIPKNKCEEYEDLEYDVDDYNPYEDSGWAGIDWFCIRCGSKLDPIAKDDKTWNYVWNSRRTSHSLLFLCSNKQCCHNSGVLTLHHPCSVDSAAGESYSISWVR